MGFWVMSPTQAHHALRGSTGKETGPRPIQGSQVPWCMKFTGAFCHLDLCQPGHTPTPPHPQHMFIIDPPTTKEHHGSFKKQQNLTYFQKASIMAIARYTYTLNTGHTCTYILHTGTKHVRPSPDHSAHLPHPIATRHPQSILSHTLERHSMKSHPPTLLGEDPRQRTPPPQSHLTTG